MPQTEFPDQLAGDIGDVLVTGASGFLGRALVRRLLANGVHAARIRCLVRDRARAEALGLPAASLWSGDLAARADGDALARAADGVDAVVHLAGVLKAHALAAFDAVNVDGTARLVRALAARAPRAHLVCVSSLAAAGPSTNGEGSAAPPADCRPVSRYGASKLRGELEVVRGASPWTIVRPPVVYGPGDAATRVLFRQACVPWTAVPPVPRPLSVIHADEVIDALLACLRVKPAGAVLPLDGAERTDTHALLRAIAAACGRRVRLVPVPLLAARCAAAAVDLYGRVRGRCGYFNGDKVREIAACGWVADGEPARRVLGFTPRVRLAEGLAAVARAEGFARGSAAGTS